MLQNVTRKKVAIRGSEVDYVKFFTNICNVRPTPLMFYEEFYINRHNVLMATET
jgi:hypothetical protein